MISKNQIRQHIENLYRQNLDADALDYEIFRLRKMRREAIYTLVELFDSEDINFKEFVVELIQGLEDLETFPILSELAYHSDKPDEIKILATTIIAYFGEEIDYNKLRENLKAPDELDEIITRNMLKDLGNPYSLEHFLKSFPEFEYEQKLVMVEYLASIVGDERLADVAGALLEYCDSTELKLSLIEALTNSKSNKAYTYLKEIIQKSTDRSVQAVARKAIFQLGELDSKGELLRVEPQAILHEAYMSSHDGNGDRICVFSTIEKRQYIKVFNFILNNRVGIKEAFGNQFNKSEYNSYIRDVKSNQSFLMTKVPPDYLLERAKQGEARTFNNKSNLPREYLAWRSIFDCQYDKHQWEDKKHQYEIFLQNVQAKEKDLIPRTPELYEDGAINSSWYFNFDQLEAELLELVQLRDQWVQTSESYRKTYARIYAKAFKRVITDEFIDSLQEMLREYAFLCFLEAKKSQAELAITAANSLRSGELDGHPFLRKMIEFTFDLHLNQVLFEEDEEIPQLKLFNQAVSEKGDELVQASRDKFINMKKLRVALNQINDNADDSTESELLPGLLPENSRLTNFEKLQYVSELLPDTPFGQTFPSDFTALSKKKQICLLNEWETAYDSFIEGLVGEIDWYELRSELGIRIPDKLIEDQLEEIETAFLGLMPERGYDWEHLRLARRLWKEFIYLKNGQISPIRKPEAWAAAIEYLVGALYYDRDTQSEVADWYGVSPASLGTRCKTLKETLNLKIYKSEGMKIFTHIGDLLTLMYKTPKEDS